MKKLFIVIIVLFIFIISGILYIYINHALALEVRKILNLIERKKVNYKVSEDSFINGWGDINHYIKYKNKKIYFKEGKKDLTKAAYGEYNLIIYDAETNTEKIIANTFDDNVILVDNKLYYFFDNFQTSQRGDEKLFYSYNLDNEESEVIEITPKVGKIYSMVAYNNNIYLGVIFNNYELSRYGIIKYDIGKKQSTVFSKRDIRCLEDNFAYIGNGFVFALGSNLYFIDLKGNESIKYTTELSLGDRVKIENNYILVYVMDTVHRRWWLFRECCTNFKI